MHAIEPQFLDALRAGRLYAYRLPPKTFTLYDPIAGYYVSREPVEPDEIHELTDLEALHATRHIDLRVTDDLWALWNEVIASSLAFSGIRLRNLDRRT